MNELELYDHTGGVILPRETVRGGCFVSTPKQMFISLMAGERVCFKEYNTAAKYYLRAAEIFRGLYREGMTDYEFVVELNNYIVRHIQYDYSVVGKKKLTAEDRESYEIDAPQFKGKGVCSAKSKFFSLLCSLANIKTVLVTGALRSSESGARHAWNKVYLQKPGETTAKWWNIDTTNNRTHRAVGDNVRGDYFLLTDREIGKTHIFMDYPETSEYKQINHAATGSFEYPVA